MAATCLLAAAAAQQLSCSEQLLLVAGCQGHMAAAARSLAAERAVVQVRMMMIGSLMPADVMLPGLKVLQLVLMAACCCLGRPAGAACVGCLTVAGCHCCSAALLASQEIPATKRCHGACL
jgi:hypothetical protein